MHSLGSRLYFDALSLAFCLPFWPDIDEHTVASAAWRANAAYDYEVDIYGDVAVSVYRQHARAMPLFKVIAAWASIIFGRDSAISMVMPPRCWRHARAARFLIRMT